MRTAEMFPKIHTPRRVLMHVWDVDCTRSYEEPGDLVRVIMKCATCGHTTEWVEIGLTESKRGVPCPACNAVSIPEHQS